MSASWKEITKESILVPGADAVLVCKRKGQCGVLCFGKSVTGWDMLPGAYTWGWQHILVCRRCVQIWAMLAWCCSFLQYYSEGLQHNIKDTGFGSDERNTAKASASITVSFSSHWNTDAICSVNIQNHHDSEEWRRFLPSFFFFFS